MFLKPLFCSLALLVVLCQASLASETDSLVRYATFNMRYDAPDAGDNAWSARKGRIAQLIRDRHIDVMGTQELLAHQADDIRELLPQYTMVGVGRDDGRRAGEYAAIFYRTDRFDCLGNGTFWLSQTPDSAGTLGWDAACVRIATWARLRDRRTGRQFMAVNTHFDHVGTEARRQSALLIIDRIRRLAADLPAVVTGDFNVDSTSQAYRTITTDPFVLEDARLKARQVEGCDYTWHNFGRLAPQDRTIIDFIFVTPGVEVLSAEIPEFTSGNYVSDHNPQFATLKL